MNARVLLLVVITSCQVDHHDDHPKQPQPDLAQRLQEAERRMHERYSASRQIVGAISVSNLADAQDNARVIDGLVDPDLLPQWQPYRIDVENAARRIVKSTSLGDASAALATLGARCASCHVAMAMQIKLDELVVLPGKTPAMLAHEQSAMNMWDGLIGPATDRWNAGAAELETMPTNLIATSSTPAFPGDLDDVARIRALAVRAKTATAQDQRAAIFGDTLRACAHCHEALRDR